MTEKPNGGAEDVVEIEPGPGEAPPLPAAASHAPARAQQADDDEPAPLSVTHLPPRAWPPKVLGDLMTRTVITVEEHEPVGDLEAWMQRFRFHHLPVVTKDMKLVGLITRTDLLHAALGISPSGGSVEKATATTPAGSIMRRGVVTGTQDHPLLTACRVMQQEQLGCLPVLFEDGTLAGIVTRTDVLRFAIDALERAG